MLRMIGSELKKYCYLPYTLIVMLGVICLGFANTVDDSGMLITVFQLMLRLMSGDEVQSIFHSALLLWKSSFSGWMVVFTPLLLTLPYIGVLSEERQNRLVQFEMIRSGNARYCVCKVISGALYGGLSFAVSYAILGCMFALIFPPISAFSAEEQAMFVQTSIIVYIVKVLCGSFVYGVFASIFGIGVAIFFRDKYMLLCLPFMLNYIYQQIIEKAASKIYVSNAELAEKIETFLPLQIGNLFMNRYWSIVLLIILGVYMGLIALFYQKVKRGKWIG